MNPFEGLVEFIAVAETQGFTSAGRRLNVSTSHISRQVAALEDKLGIALVARTTRRVKLTAVGQSYYESCKDLLAGIEQANETVSKDKIELEGTLRVSAAGEFSEQHVVPALLEFGKLHPELSIEIDFNSRLVSFVDEGIDFAIRYGRLSDSGLVARKLANRTMVAAASMDYFDKYGVPESPKDLSAHRCLIAANDRWSFDTPDGPLQIRVNGNWRSNSGRSIVKACQAGLGIAYMPRSSFGSALEDGSLVTCLHNYVFRSNTNWIVYANRKYLATRARLAIDYLLNHFKDWQE